MGKGAEGRRTADTPGRGGSHPDCCNGMCIINSLDLSSVTVLDNPRRKHEPGRNRFRHLRAEKQLPHLGRRAVRTQDIIRLKRRPVIKRERHRVIRRLQPGKRPPPANVPLQTPDQHPAHPPAGHAPGARRRAAEHELPRDAVVDGQALGLLVKVQVRVAHGLRQARERVLGQQAGQDGQRPVDQDGPVAAARVGPGLPLEDGDFEAGLWRAHCLVRVFILAIRQNCTRDGPRPPAVRQKRQTITFFKPCAAIRPVRPAPMIATFVGWRGPGAFMSDMRLLVLQMCVGAT
jgi:hypothetical protein